MSTPSPARLVLLLPLAVAAGCSTATVPQHGEAARPPAAGVASAATGRRPARPVPEVIAKPKPFRMADAAAAVSTGAPGVVAPTHAPAHRLATDEQPHPTVKEVRAMLRSYLRAFNRHDAAALAAHWSETGENLDLDSGEVTAAGPTQVRDVFASLFAADDAATIDIDVHSIRPIRDDVAVVDGASLISFADGTPASSRFSAVVVRQDGRWVLETVREAATAPPAPGMQRPLEDLAWLVGSWEDDGAGVIASTRCAWSPDRGFLVRTHLVTPDLEPRPPAGDAGIPALLPTADAKPREITEVIGWDPDQDAIRSWIFAGDGRFAEGTWQREGDRWIVRVEGRGRDEGAVASFTVAGGPDGLAIEGDAGRLAALLPPPCRFTRTAR